MTIQLWLAFVAASAVVLVVPGPTILTVISYSIAHGHRATPAVVPGVSLGDSTALAVSLVGLGTLLAASAAAFTVIKFAGGAYLVYLGIRMLRAGISPAGPTPMRSAPDTRLRMFFNTYVVTALNPKSIMFFVAFLPQFVNHNVNVSQQLWLLAITFVVMATLNSSMYSLFAASAHQMLSAPTTQRRLNLLGGCILAIAGIWALLAHHAP